MGMMSELLYNIDPSTMILGLVFIILYALINFSLSKIFKKERASSAIISLCVSLLAVYGLNMIDFNLSGVLFNLGISEDLLYLIVPWIILGVAIWASFVKDKTTGKINFRLYRLFMILGAILLLIGLIPGVYEQTIFIIAGIILILLGILFWFLQFRKRKGRSYSRTPFTNSRNDFRGNKRKSMLPGILIVLGLAAIIAGSILGYAPATYLLVGIILIAFGLIIIPLLRFIGISAGI
jgi:LPXTG-motif cell wall-anchored protein